MRQPRITHCPYCGKPDPSPVPGGDQVKERIARCNRCGATFTASVVEWDKGKPAAGESSSYEWKKR